MGKTSARKLVEAIADDFNTYVDKGVRLDPVLRDFDPDLNVDDLDRLLRIHFVLTERDGDRPGVIDFVRTLPDRVRRLKTTNSHRLVTREGEIRGRVAWDETIKRRYREGGGRRNQYVCRETRENYDIEENIVLKSLLARIHEIVFGDLEHALESPADYGWLAEWVDAENQFANEFDDIFRDNIYLRRIESADHEVTNRMLRSVKQSRNPLYSEAAQLLDRYRRLMNYDLDATEATSLLENTFIRPEQTETLFELYWVFRILDCYDSVQFELLDGGSDIVASWETNASRYLLYHNSTGSSTLSFSEQLAEIDRPTEDGYVYRTINVLDRWQQLADDLFDITGRDSLWGGRPDIILERYDEDTTSPDAVFVGEVKYTTNSSYAAQGLRELLEYMAYVRKDGEYMEYQDDVLDSKQVTGMLFVDHVNFDSERTESDITLRQFGDPISKPL
ncbi:hypothetical protein [Natronosalvus halobius]|uniref:hypothetical protein n=1 Tax=Natronosalvus halobius TaxID=2953746 RepID=UPI0020A19C3E|nr:hypothetical protein [Natronosalvus halobius]USZ73496.1 hypothetical protein NGM15_17670 [Natronosalvus halobius]